MTVRKNKLFKSLLQSVRSAQGLWIGKVQLHADTVSYERYQAAKYRVLAELLKNEEVRELVLAKCDKNLRADLLAAGVL